MLVAALIGMDHNHWFTWKETSTLEVPCTTPLKIDFAQSLPNSAKISINIGLSSLKLVRAQPMVIPMQLI